MSCRPTDCETAISILEAAEGLFERYGYRKTTVDEIAQAAGLGKGTIYLYFKSKEDLAYAWLEHLHRDLRQAIVGIGESPGPGPERAHRFLMTRVLARYDIFSRSGRSMEEVLETLKPNLWERRDQFHAFEAGILAQILTDGIADQTVRPLDSVRTAHSMVTATNDLMPYYRRPQQLGDRNLVEDRTRDLADLLCLAISERP